MKKLSLLSVALLAALFFTSCTHDSTEKVPALYQKISYDGDNASWNFFDAQLISCYGTRATNTITATLRITPKIGTTAITFANGRSILLTDNTQTYNYVSGEMEFAKYQSSDDARTFSNLTEGASFDVTFKFPGVPTTLCKIKTLTFNGLEIVFNGYRHYKWFEVWNIPYYPISDTIVWN